MKEPRYFESQLTEEELKAEQTKTVKLDRSKSRFAQQTEKKQSFQQIAQEISDKGQSYLNEAFELGQEYKTILIDKTLSINKKFTHKNRENEVISKLMDFARKLNNDRNQPEGDGSVTLIVLLLKNLLFFRDKYNDIEYKYSMLEKNHIKLEEKFNRLSSRLDTDEKK